MARCNSNRSTASVVLLSWMYSGSADPIPQNFKHRQHEARNEEIRLKFAGGSEAADLAAEYGVSVKHVYQIVHHQRK